MQSSTSLTGNERTFLPDEIIVTKTDLTGKLTYVNQVFLQLAGYSEEECLGQQHNMIRHPEMPRAVFKLLWDTLQSGEEIFAYVNNRSKNGDYYWVFAHVTPSRDISGNVVGYHSNRRVPNKQVIQEHIAPLYQKLFEIEKSSTSAKDGLDKSFQAVVDLLADSKMTFNQFMFSLGV
ncbi:MAG: PAS domain-containing protein [Alphaproteobacteria bacterium]|jgi:PAS domain S-box-containing protein|nr:PAS domain-containing protein [Alphaproteobacteria bacterium]MBT4017353.1 PAS domain-containing protein [Alphaproteobacteria bacterium]MBT4965866.1 PAS domain-containing protein [Alphaproteobacteria bacterium]MBT5158795.1 PAS domain-containing protein [Alphaproteobacteria bacterium]MBT6387373.1 PAS domain-containing protein [Alphaproteobacteria bacterium]